MANPVLREGILKSSSFNSLDSEHAMTINGTILKTCVLGALMAVTFAYTWYLALTGFADKAIMLGQGGSIVGFVLAIIICFAPKNKFLIITTPLYAMCEGLFLGWISAMFNMAYPGIAPQAAMGTMLALFGMFILYKTKLVKCTDKFRMVIFNSTLAIAGIYLLQVVLSFFNHSIPQIFSNSLIGIGFSLVCVAVASFNLIVDFDSIERFQGQASKDYEWFFGFSLMVTIVWMYIELLKLLAKLQSRNN